jgi:hypothetical protein
MVIHPLTCHNLGTHRVNQTSRLQCTRIDYHNKHILVGRRRFPYIHFRLEVVVTLEFDMELVLLRIVQVLQNGFSLVSPGVSLRKMESTGTTRAQSSTGRKVGEAQQPFFCSVQLFRAQNTFLNTFGDKAFLKVSFLQALVKPACIQQPLVRAPFAIPGFYIHSANKVKRGLSSVTIFFLLKQIKEKVPHIPKELYHGANFGNLMLGCTRVSVNSRVGIYYKRLGHLI